MRSQIALLSLLVGIATVVQPTALAESADACTQVGDKACELAEDAIAGDAEAMAGSRILRSGQGDPGP